MNNWAGKLWQWEDKGGMSHLPKTIDELKSLDSLSFVEIGYLDEDKVNHLPEEIGNLIELTHLGLGSATHSEIYKTCVTSLPNEIGNLSKLTSLHAQFNRLEELPIQIGKLTQLEDLKLGGNKLTSLPKEIGDLASLKILTLWSNNIEHLPKEIGNLHKLEGLDINNNPITRLPNEIVNLTHLKTFYYDKENLLFNEQQKIWIEQLRGNGCDINSEAKEVGDLDFDFDEGMPF